MSQTIFLQSLLFLYLNACAGSTAFVLAWMDKEGRTHPSGFLAAWATWFLALIVVTETVLGAVGLLRVAALTVVFTVAAVAAWVWFARSPQAHVVSDPWRASLQHVRHALVEGRSQYALILHTLVLLSVLATAFTITALVEPTALFDSFVYHLVMPVDWLQHGTITPMYIPGAEVANSYFPGNAELLYFWTLAPFRNDLVVRFVPVGMWLLLGLGLWRLCRQSGAGPAASCVAAVIFLFTPLALSQATELWTDGALAALFVLALSHLAAYARRPSRSTAALFGLAGGLCLGIKYSGPAYLALLCLGFVLIAWGQRRRRLASALSEAALVLAGALAAGGGWYLRNLLQAGNPMYPVPVAAAGLTLFPGPGASFGDTLWQFARALRLRDVLSAALAGYGVVFWLTVGVGVGFGAWQVLGRRRGPAYLAARGARAWLVFVAGLALVAFLLYLNTPYSVMRFSAATPITPVELAAGMRFSLIAGACATVLLAIALDLGPARANPAWVLAGLALLVGCLIGYDTTSFHFFPSRIFTLPRVLAASVLVAVVLFAVRGFAEVQARRRLDAAQRWDAARAWVVLGVGGFVVVCALVLVLAGLKQYRESYRYAIYFDRYLGLADSWRWLDDNINNARVAYLGDPRMLAAYGADFSNEVRYMNVAGSLDERYDDFFARRTGYRDQGSYEVWQRNLAEWRADYLVVASRPLVAEDNWAVAHPEFFTRIYEQGYWRVYRISPDLQRTASVP